MRSATSRHLFLAFTLLLIGFATLRPVGGQPSMVWTTCLLCGDHGTADLILNVLLFAPLGAALAGEGIRPARAMIIGACLSLAIEIAQLYIPGRDSSLSDVIANTSGTALGGGFGAIWGSLRDRRLAVVASLAAFTVCLLTGLVLAPAFPNSRYYGQWTPNLGHLEWYRGRVQTATLDAQRLPSGPIDDSQRTRALLSADSGFVLHVRGIAGPRPSRLSSFFSIYDNQRREILLVGPDRDDLVFRLHTVAAFLRLDRPDVRLASVLHDIKAGDPLDVTIRARGGVYQVGLNAAAYTAGFTVGSGWALLLYPEDSPAWLRQISSALWVGAWFFPIGLWLRTRREAVLAAAAVVASLFGVPAVTALVATPAIQWTSALLGIGAGLALQIALVRRPTGANPGL